MVWYGYSEVECKLNGYSYEIVFFFFVTFRKANSSPRTLILTSIKLLQEVLYPHQVLDEVVRERAELQLIHTVQDVRHFLKNRF